MALSKQPSKLWVAGSNPAGRTIKSRVLISFLKPSRVKEM